MDFAAFLVCVALVLVVVDVFVPRAARFRPLAIAVALVCVAVLLGVTPVLHT